MFEITPDVQSNVKDIVLLIAALLVGFALGYGLGETTKRRAK